MPIQGFDIWFYLEIGRHVVEQFEIPWSESFLGTTEIYAFGRHANQSWLASVVCFLFYKAAGIPGLVLLRSLLITAIAGVTYGNCRLFGLSASWSSLIVLLGVWTVRGRFLLRTVLFTDLLLAALLSLLIWHQKRGDENSFPYLPLAILMAVWTNTHQGVVAGCVCLFLWLFTRKFPWKTRVLALAVAGFATLVRPHGWWFPAFFTDHFGNHQAISGVLEWAPLEARGILELAPLVLIGALAFGLCLKRKVGPWGNAIIAVVFVFMAVRSQRAVGELLPVLVPMVASFLALREPPRRLQIPFALCLAALLYTGWLGEPLQRLSSLGPKYPKGLTEELPADHGQIFNSYEFGNYLVFQQKRPFIHGITALYKEQLLIDFHNILNRNPKRLELLERFAVTEVMLHHPTQVDSTEQLVEDLFESDQWHLTWWDDSGLLFSKGRGRDLKAVTPWRRQKWQDPTAAKEQLEQMIAYRPSAVALSLRGILALNEGETELGLQSLEESLKLDPDSYSALLAHGSGSFQIGDLDAAERSLSAAVSLAPGAPIAHFNLALLYLRTNKAAEAIDQLEKVLEIDPQFPGAQDLLNKAEASR